MAFEPKRNMEAELEAEVYQGSASPHSVIVKHINQVLAAEHKHMVEYQREQEQIQVERRVRHERERTQLAAQAHSINPIINNTNESIPLDATKDDDMNLKQLAATVLTVGTLVSTSACSQEELNQPIHNSAGEKIVTGDAFRISKNPQPQHGYKLKVKIKNAPEGGFGDFGASVDFDIANIKQCGYYLGGSYQGTVPAVRDAIDFPLTKLSDSEYEGVFYTDWGKDGDFFGKGVCHWRFRDVGVGFRATGKKGETSFVVGFHDLYDELTGEHVPRDRDDIFDFKQTKSQTRFYLKKHYPTISDFPNYNSSGINSEVAKQHKSETVFSITLTTEEIQ
jgi:hypothetical protein